MKKPTVIVLDTLLGGVDICRELRNAGYKVIIIGYKGNIANPGLHIKGVKGYLLSSPQKDPNKFLAELLDIGSHYDGPKVLLPATESYCFWLAANQERLNKFYYLTPSLELLNIINDKWYQYRFFKKIGINVPLTAKSDGQGIKGWDSYPAIVKPRYTETTVAFKQAYSRKVFEAYNRKQLEKACRSALMGGFETIIQENVPGKDESQFLYGGAAKKGRAYTVCLTQKLKAYPSPNGSGMVVKTIEHSEILRLGDTLLATMQYSGICDLEFKMHENTGAYYLIEFNPRYGVGQKVMELAGIPSSIMYVRLALGEIPKKSEIARPGYYWIYFDEWLKEKILPWRNRSLKMNRNVENTCKTFDHSDWRPELLHIFTILWFKFKRLF
jgi:predicted ATP-grasp superfamily ATP-dependent carboligase